MSLWTTACVASSNAVVVPTHSVKKPRFSDQNRAKGFPSVRTSVPQQDALQKAFLFDHTESCHAWLRWRLARTHGGVEPKLSLYVVSREAVTCSLNVLLVHSTYPRRTLDFQMGRKTVKLKTGRTLPTACTVRSSLVPVASLSWRRQRSESRKRTSESEKWRSQQHHSHKKLRRNPKILPPSRSRGRSAGRSRADRSAINEIVYRPIFRPAEIIVRESAFDETTGSVNRPKHTSAWTGTRALRSLFCNSRKLFNRSLSTSCSILCHLISRTLVLPSPILHIHYLRVLSSSRWT